VRPLGSRSEPLPHATEGMQPARIGRIGMVDDAVLEHESAHARPLAQVRGPINPGSPYTLIIGRKRPKPGAGWLQRVFAVIVVFDASIALIFLAVPDALIAIKVPAGRRRPRE